jgi:hypothetical protein
MKLILPAVFAVNEIRAGNRIRQIAEPATGVDGTIVGFIRDRIEGFLFTAATDGIETLIIAKSKPIPQLILRAVVGAVDLNAANADLSTARWLQHPVLTAMAGRPFDYGRTVDDIRMSWISAFS